MGTYLAREERRRTILDAALVVLRDHGIAAVTARSVAAQLGGSQGQIHHHFGSTTQLAAEAWILFTTTQIEDFETWTAGVAPTEAVGRFFEGLRGGEDDGALALWAEAGAHARLTPGFAPAYLATLQQVCAVLEDLLDRERPDAGNRDAAMRLLMVGIGLAGLTTIAPNGETGVLPARVIDSAIAQEVSRLRRPAEK
jgi:AcrR family transcriptional regulator